MSNPVITLTTDFGLADPYVAEMKAVILKINPSALIIDITHQVEKFNVRMGSYILAAVAPYFPDGTIHVAVVDPSVGTKRKPIIIETGRAYFIGPDNGILVLAAKQMDIKNVYEITNPKFMLSKVSSTFHGRDIFAPAAAHLSRGVGPSELGVKISRIVMPKFTGPIFKRDFLEGEIVYIDGFGNIITNITAKHLDLLGVKEKIGVRLGKLKLNLKLCRAYGDVEAKETLAIIGSNDFLEISINQGNAANTYNIKVGDKIRLYRSL